MLKIGDFSKRVESSIRTLRYYDDIDLFKPMEVDVFTGYRYYTEEQIDDFNLINELKEVGFSLEEIKEHWNDFDDDKFLTKKSELYEIRDNVKAQIRKIDHLRSRISDGKIRTKEIFK